MLARQAALYTMGESSSLPEYDAYRLLASACFVLGVDPNEPDRERLHALAAEGVEAAFARELAGVEEEARRIEPLWRAACLSMPLLESVALRDTLESLRDFGARYEPRFFAHEIPADIDYPLSWPVDESTQGVRYVTAYLERLLAECRFLQRFDVERCRSVLRAVHPAYGELLVNLFEPVAANAVGCVLAGVDVRALEVGDEGQTRIAKLLAGASSKRRRALIEEAADAACDAVGLRGPEAEDACDLVRRAAVGLEPRLEVALRHNALAGIFAR